MLVRSSAVLFSVILYVLTTNSAFGQEPVSPTTRRKIPAVKTDTPPKIDGDLSDPAWLTAPKAEGFIDRVGGNQATDRTTAYILYDQKYIYIAFHCEDSKPESISARETVRDYRTRDFDKASEDCVEVNFDAFHGHSDHDRSIFSLNALGTRGASLAGGRGGKLEWRGDWDGAVMRTPSGWNAEMRIPWQGLNYPSGGAAISMGINFVRYQSRTRVQSIWSNVGPNNFYELDGDWTGIVAPGGPFHPKLSLLPYLLPRFGHAGASLRTGLDARFTLTPQLTAVGTINPDFATVEGAIEPISFSRSERFVPEKRPFFLEGADLFRISDFNVIGGYLFTNHIPAFDAGAKVYGKLTPTDTIALSETVAVGRRSDLAVNYRHACPLHRRQSCYSCRRARSTTTIRWPCLPIKGERASLRSSLNGRSRRATTPEEMPRSSRCCTQTSSYSGLWGLLKCPQLSVMPMAS